jgi:hypothetical protein
MFRQIIVILIAILLLSVSIKAQQQNGSVFENRITINQKNQSLNFILDQISWQAGVFFSYDASILIQHKNTASKLQTNRCILF